ncbi:MAG: VWA domain-containing protein [Bacteroidales bacterium]|nr:VWA domain-containing protein [Bacteroidales bacterium]
MIHFAHINYLWLLILIPVLVAIYVVVHVRNKRQLLHYADSAMLHRLQPSASTRRPALKFGIAMLGLASLIVALAGPQMGTKITKGERLGSDIAICIDVSNSMMAEDIQPNRLERSKRAVSNLIGELGSDRVSLIVFAGASFIQMPLTTDYGAALMFLDQIDCNMVNAQGTAIGDAISKAMESFGYGSDEEQWERNGSRAIIVISDGENHEDDAVGMARKAYREGIVVNTIGMGLPQGVPIPEYRNGRVQGYKKDRNGQTVTTQLNEAMLAEIAREGGGVYVRAGNINAGLSDIVKQLNSLDKSSFGESLFSEYESRYYYPLALALLCLVAELLIMEKRNARFNIGKLLARSNQDEHQI